MFLWTWVQLPPLSPPPQLWFFKSVSRPFQDYFSSYQNGQSEGGAKTGEPREKPPGTPTRRTWLLSHVARAGLEPTPDKAVRWSSDSETALLTARPRKPSFFIWLYVSSQHFNMFSAMSGQSQRFLSMNHHCCEIMLSCSRTRPGNPWWESNHIPLYSVRCSTTRLSCSIKFL